MSEEELEQERRKVVRAAMAAMERRGEEMTRSKLVAELGIARTRLDTLFPDDAALFDAVVAEWFAPKLAVMDEVMASDLNWLAERPRPGDRVQVQLRHRAPPVGATVAEVEGTLRLTLHAPHAAVTPGQSAVLFQGERLIGGGRIRASDRPSRLSA